METLRNRWKLFLDVVLDPWNLLLTVSVGAFFYLSLGQTSSLASALLFVLITITSAILGGRITKQWVDVTEGGVVVARGRSAVRSLKLLLRNVAALEARIRKFRSQEDEIEKHPEVTKRNYEEAIEICNLLQEQTVNSVENWTDIIPEADIKTEIGVISDLKGSLNDKENDLIQLKQQLDEDKGKSEQERNQLKGQIKDKEKQIKGLERDILDRRVELGRLGVLGRLEFDLDRLGRVDPLLSGGASGGALPQGRVNPLLSSGGALSQVTDVTPGSNLGPRLNPKSEEKK